ncbi:DsrE/DsrF/DrsH-like family protein [Elusimicrobiota bacterium]
MKEKMTIILFSGDLDKALAAFTLATTAAASNMDVSIFFTFWGLNVLKKPGAIAGSARLFLQKVFGRINKGLPLSRFNFLGIGPWLMKIIMRKVGAASLDDLMRSARQLNVKYIACTTSIGVLGLSREDLAGEVDDFAGASTYLASAKESKVNLFI